jgi:uracil-DNA glycosylase family 4
MALGDNKFNGNFGRGRDKRILTGIRVQGEGPVPCPVMFIGERPNKQDVQGKVPTPYRGLGREEMDRFLQQADIRDLSMDTVYTTFAVKDYQEHKKVFILPEEMERDKGELELEMEVCQPYIVCAMGRYAMEMLVGGHVDMDKEHGIPRWWTSPVLGPVILLPVSSPALAFFNADNQTDVINDFVALRKVRSGILEPRQEEGHIADWKAVYEPNWIVVQPEQPGIAFDTEGWLHRPWGLSASDRDGLGWVSKAGDNSAGTFSHQLALRVRDNPAYRIWVHNALHDLPILEALDVELPMHNVRDTMIYAYLLGDEPQALKPLAYRHAGMTMKSYEEVVAPYYNAVFEEYVRTAAEIPDLPDWEEQFVIVEDGQAKIKKPWGIARHLRRLLADYDKAQAAGKEFTFADRWGNIDEYKKRRVVDVLGDPPELSLEFVPEDEAIQYSGCDAVATRRVAPILERRIRERNLTNVSEIDHSVLPMFDRMQRIGCMVDVDHFVALGEECTELLSANRTAIHKLCGADINVDSGDQVAALLFDQLKLDRKVDFRIPTTEAGDRYSTNDKILEALRFTHPVVGLVCDGREISKVRSSFCWPLARYGRADRDRRIHPRFKLTRVSSGRPACSDPNLLAIPTRSALGKRVRAGFIAKPGCVLGDWDLSQIEMRWMADESQDGVLRDAFISGRDVHDETGSRLSGIRLAEYVADKPTRKKWRDPAKRVNFGVITQITEVGLAAQMRLAQATKNDKPLEAGGEPWTEDDCRKMLADYFQSYTGVQAYIDQCRAEALRYGYVRDRWGRMRLLPGAHSHIGRIREEALRAASSHKIQSGAAGFMKQCQARVWEYIVQWREEGRYIEPLLQVYDELLLEVEDDEAFKEEVNAAVVYCMTETIKLSVPVGADGGYGYNWTEAKG